MSDMRGRLLALDGAERLLEPVAAALRAAGLEVVRSSGGTPVPLEVDGLLVHLDVLDGRAEEAGLLRRGLAAHAPLFLFAPRPLAEAAQLLAGGVDDVFEAPWEEGRVVARVGRAVSLKRQVDALQAQVAELTALSTTDGLTGICNHRAFQERLREEFRRAQRHEDALSLVLLDLDHFKEVNDTHGHLVGDAVLREVAAALRGCARDTDFLCRYGGEEFAFLLPRTPLGGALTLAERTRQALAALRVGPRGRLRVSASMGLAGLPHRSVHTPEALLQAADEALYRAKAQGRNRVCLAHGRTDPGPTPSVR